MLATKRQPRYREKQPSSLNQPGRVGHSPLMLESTLRFGCDGHLNVGALFEPHIIAILVSQRIFNTEVPIPLAASANRNLRFFWLAWTWRGDDFVHCSGHGSTWLFWSSRSIELQFAYSSRLRHARFRHFHLHASAYLVVGFFLTFLMQHAPIMTSGWKPFSAISHRCEIYNSPSVFSK